MSNVLTCEEILEQGTGESILHCVDFTRWLRKDSSGAVAATLTGTPTVVEVTTTDLTLANKAVNSSEVIKRHNSEAVAIGCGVQFRSSGGDAGEQYQIKITTTDGSDTFVCFVKLQVV